MRKNAPRPGTLLYYQTPPPHIFVVSPQNIQPASPISEPPSCSRDNLSSDPVKCGGGSRCPLLVPLALPTPCPCTRPLSLSSRFPSCCATLALCCELGGLRLHRSVRGASDRLDEVLLSSATPIGDVLAEAFEVRHAVNGSFTAIHMSVVVLVVTVVVVVDVVVLVVTCSRAPRRWAIHILLPSRFHH